MSTIFISHSGKDNSAAAELKRHLEMQGHRSVFLDFDPESGIPPGRNWEQELYRYLRICQAMIVLCSEHSMSSRWCFAEITHAKSLGKHVFPVKVCPCTIDPVLTSRQIIDLTQNQEDAYQRLWRGLKASGLDPADSFDWDCNRSPYPGMMAFQEEDAAVFFGREEEIQQGLEMLQRLRQFGGARMLLVLGASGSGKSSLVRAGLLPRLRRNPGLWLIVDPFRPHEHPLRELAVALTDSFPAIDQKRNWKDICAQLEKAASCEKSHERAILNEMAIDLQIAWKRREATMLLIIDQAEELLARSEGERTASFLSLLHSALEVPNSPVMAIFTLRSDFLGDFQRQQGLLGLSRKHLPVGPMAKDHLAKIIEGPARIAGINLEDGLTEAMIQDTKSQDALPLLAFTLRELYEHYGNDKLLEVHEYREKLGGLNGAVARAADAALAAAQLSTDQEEDLRTSLVSLARINEQGQFTRQPVRWSDLPESVHSVLESFVQARLLISRGEGKERLLEAAHEALFHSWVRLKGWLDEDREFLLWRKRFNEAQQEWLRTGRDPRALLSGPALSEGQSWLKRRANSFAPSECNFLEKSLRLAKKQRNQKLWALASTIVFLIAVAIGGVVLWKRAEKQAVVAQKAQKVAEQQAELARRGTYNIQLARVQDLWQRDPDQALKLLNDVTLVPLDLRDFTWGFFYRLANKTRMTLTGHTDGVVSVVFSPDGKTLASGSWDNTIKLWKTETGKERTTLIGHTDNVNSVAFSPDGKTLASASSDKTIKLWETKTGRERNTLTGHTGVIYSVAFSPDGKTLASGSYDNTIKLWETKTGREQTSLAVHAEVNSVAFSPDSKTLASASEDKTIKLWETKTGQQRTILTGHTLAIYSVAFSPDGKTLASAGSDKTIKLWETKTGRERNTLTGHTGVIYSVAFSPDSKILASVSSDKTIKLWKVETGQERSALTGHIYEVTSVAFSPNGKTLVSASSDTTIKLWETETGQERATLPGHTKGVFSVVFSPDSKTLVSGSWDKTIKLWEVETGQQRTTLTRHTDRVRSVAFSPDGKTLVSASADKTIKLWETKTGRERNTLTGHAGVIYSVAFSPDGKTLASASLDKTIKLWETETGQERNTLTGHTGVINSVAFSPDSKALASASSDKTIKLWEAKTGQQRATLTGHTDEVNSVAFSPDGKTLASASSDKTIKLWETETGQERNTLTGHTGMIYSVAFSPDSKTLASASEDKTIKLWEAKTGQQRATLTGHTDEVFFVAFSLDGKALASASLDKTIKLWEAASSEMRSGIREAVQ